MGIELSTILSNPCCLMVHTNEFLSIHPSIHQALLARSWRHKHGKTSRLEEKKGSSSLLHASVLNLPCLLPHALTSSCSNTYTHCICFVVDLPPPDCECCGLLQRCYYGIVSGCDENRHKQWCVLNENKNSCTSQKKRTQTQKAPLIYAFLYLSLTRITLYILYMGLCPPTS